ncbi:MAG: long-chain fatty acid--CoA ligase [bacterium]|nr:long-chain fatty acid--CoA ligase [bacterium]
MNFTDGYPVNKALLAWAEKAELPTLPKMFDRCVSEFGSRPYVGTRQGDNYVFRTYNEVHEDILNFASAMVSLGIEPGERVANFSNNRLEWPVVDFGSAYAACVHTPMYPTLSRAEMAYIVKDCQAKIIVAATKEHTGYVLESLDEFPHAEHVIAIDHYDFADNQAKGRVRLWNWDEFMAFGREHLEENAGVIKERADSLKADDICSFVYTSGTTGNPKGAMLMHGNFMSGAAYLAPFILLTPNDVELSFLPLSHVFERICYYALTISGSSIGYVKGIRYVPQDLQLLKPTIVPSVPRLFEKVFAKVIEMSAGGIKNKVFTSALKVGRKYREAKKNGKVSLALKAEYAMAEKMVFSKIRARLGGKVRFFISGGAPLRRDVAEFFLDVGASILEGYGLTETSPVICVNCPGGIKVGTVGPVAPGVEMMIAPDGEILARGPNIMRGYFGKLPETLEMIDEDGWLHTGDIGSTDEDGYLTITDRKKEILVLSNGKNVAPQPLELAIKMSPWIELAVLVGNDRESVGALIQPNFAKLEEWAKQEGYSPKHEDLAVNAKVYSLLMNEVREACKDFSNYEKVKRIAVLPRALSEAEGELTPSLKVKRRIVDAHFRELVESIYDRQSSEVPAVPAPSGSVAQAAVKVAGKVAELAASAAGVTAAKLQAAGITAEKLSASASGADDKPQAAGASGTASGAEAAGQAAGSAPGQAEGADAPGSTGKAGPCAVP